MPPKWDARGFQKAVKKGAKIINKKFPVCDVKKLPVVFNGKISETKMIKKAAVPHPQTNKQYMRSNDRGCSTPGKLEKKEALM